MPPVRLAQRVVGSALESALETEFGVGPGPASGLGLASFGQASGRGLDLEPEFARSGRQRRGEEQRSYSTNRTNTLPITGAATSLPQPGKAAFRALLPAV